MAGLNKILLNARLAGIDLGLSRKSRVRTHGPVQVIGAAAASAALFRPSTQNGAQLPDYTLDEDSKAVTVTSESFGYESLRGYHQCNVGLALKDMHLHDISPQRLRSGHAYVLLQKMNAEKISEPLAARRHAYVGGTLPEDREFMSALAAQELSRLMSVHGHQVTHPSYFRQVIIVVPPIDPISAHLPWFTHDCGFDFAFSSYLKVNQIEYKMGSKRVAQLKTINRNWHDMKPTQTLRSVDLMEAVRASSGSLHKPAC